MARRLAPLEIKVIEMTIISKPWSLQLRELIELSESDPVGVVVRPFILKSLKQQLEYIESENERLGSRINECVKMANIGKTAKAVADSIKHSKVFMGDGNKNFGLTAKMADDLIIEMEGTDMLLKMYKEENQKLKEIILELQLNLEFSATTLANQ